MALVLISETQDAETWRGELARLLPEAELRVWPDVGDVDDVDMALVWSVPPGELKRYRNLGCICSLGHGVDHLFAAPDELPAGVPVIRLVDEAMVRQMTAYVLAAVLRRHCRIDDYDTLKAEARWHQLEAYDPAERRVAVLGLGALGGDVAAKLVGLGFRVAGWSRTAKTLPGVEAYAGRAGLERCLADCDIVVCLLPLTAETRDILDARAFGAMKRGAYLVNTARGHHVVEEDLLAALDSGHLAGACLDVFRTEPLPADHPFWRHPKVTVTPHISAVTLARTAAPQVAENYRRLREGRELLNVVDPGRGY